MSNPSPRIIGIILARGGSKRIPRKNITPLCGRPLIYYTIREAKRSKFLEAFVVSTDDEEIAAVARSFGADVPFLRPKELAEDTTPDLPVFQHVLQWLGEARGWDPEIAVHLRPTAPLRTAEDIDGVIRIMEETGCDSVRTISRPAHNPFKMWYRDAATRRMTPLLPTEHYAEWGTDVPSQLLPQNVYWQNAMVDATRVRFIREGRMYGPDIRGVVTDPRKAVDLDEPEDLAVAAERLEEFGLID